MSRAALSETKEDFSRFLREAEGEEIFITRNGKPVARLSPVTGRRVLTPEQEAAWERTKRRMEEGWAIGAGPLDRDSLHER